MDRGAWWVTVHGVTKESDTTQLLNNNKGPDRVLTFLLGLLLDPLSRM